MQILTKNAYPSATAIQQLLLCLKQNLRIEKYPINNFFCIQNKFALYLQP